MADLKVLVVDDQADVADSLVNLVKSWGYRCEVAYDGHNALIKARDIQPHVVLLDIMMPPGIDGFAVAKELKSIVNLKLCTIIGVTALGDEGHRHCGWDSGFHFYLVKPVEPAKIKKILGSLNRSIDLEKEQREIAIESLTKKLAQQKKHA